MTRTLKKISLKKTVSGQKQRSKQTQAVPKETQQISKFTQKPINYHKKAKTRAYTTVRSKPACIRENLRAIHVYTRL